MRDHRKVADRLRILISYFGSMELYLITPAVIEEFKLSRLETVTNRGTERQIALSTVSLKSCEVSSESVKQNG